MFQPKRIVVPMDFSNEALAALDWAVMLAKQAGGVSVCPAYVFAVLPNAAAATVERTGYEEVTESWAKEQMAALQWNRVYVKGNPAEEIIDKCRLHGNDLVVMPNHARERYSDLLHSSVAQAIVHSAPCPVFVLDMNHGGD